MLTFSAPQEKLIRAGVTMMVALAILLAGTNDARSQPKALTQEQKEQASRLVTKGRKALKERRFQTAVLAFKKAYRLWPRPVMLFNLAIAYLAAGKQYKAAVLLHKYMMRTSQAEQKAIPPEIRSVLKGFAIVDIHSSMSHGTIYVDGQRYEAPNLSIVVWPGKHAIELRRGAAVVMRRLFRCLAGQHITFRLESLAASKRPQKSGSIHPRFRPRRRRKLHWGYLAATTALTLAALAGMTYTGIRGKQLEEKWSRDPSPAYRTQGERMMLITNVLIGVSGALGLTSAILAAFTEWKRGTGPHKKRVITLLPGPGPIGLNLRLSF